MKSIQTMLILLLAALIAMPMFSHAEKRRYVGKTSIFISYANAKSNPDLENSFLINLGFNDDTTYKQFIMDTGSCGIVASPDIFKPAPDAVNLGPGETNYTNGSFERVLTGTYWSATQQIYNEKGKLVATSLVPVLQVTHEVDNGQVKTPSGVAVMGIGFGREGDFHPPKTPVYNPFLNLTSVLRNGKLKPLPKDWVNGYIVSDKGVELGLTAKNTKKAGFIKLKRWKQFSTSSLPEWMPMSMTVCVNGVCGNGMSVMDTGITNAIINPPSGVNVGALINCPDTQQAKCVDDGNMFSVYYPNQKHPVAFYTFTTGQTDNPMQPNSVAFQNRPTIYWNTSRHLIGGMNFIYDNKNGYAGFIWNRNTSSKYGYVIPSK